VQPICRYFNPAQPIEGQLGEGCGGEPAIKLVGFHTSCCRRATVESPDPNYYLLLFIIIIYYLLLVFQFVEGERTVPVWQ
jgi:hypothetical protein